MPSEPYSRELFEKGVSAKDEELGVYLLGAEDLDYTHAHGYLVIHVRSDSEADYIKEKIELMETVFSELFGQRVTISVRSSI